MRCHVMHVCISSSAAAGGPATYRTTFERSAHTQCLVAHAPSHAPSHERKWITAERLCVSPPQTRGATPVNMRPPFQCSMPQPGRAASPGAQREGSGRDDC
jgi:hypothetical protein